MKAYRRVFVTVGLAATLPEQSAPAIVHGDYRLDNVLVTSDGAPMWIDGGPRQPLPIETSAARFLS